MAVYTKIARLLSAGILACCAGTFAIAAPGKQVEKLDRGVVAIHTGAGNFIGWRALGTDAPGATFDLYRDGRKLNAQPLTVTNFMDGGAAATARYTVRTAGAPEGAAGATWEQPYKTVPLQKPAGGTTPDGKAYTYNVNDGSVADLDGDGSYELLVKWQPTNAHDNSHPGYTGNTYIDAYKLDGTRLWRIDLGRNIRAGAHYTTYLAYDFDGDGKAEVMMKTADGSVDGQGNSVGKPVGNAQADYRNANGYVLDGPEFLTVFDGRSGAALASTNYLPARGDVKAWGDAYGNRADRFLGTVAYLDGARPSAVFSRGYYTRAVLAAWDWRDGKLSSRWVFDSEAGTRDGKPGPGAAANHQGAHWMSVADVDGDGKDDLVYGAATIRSDGTLLYSTGLCHGDTLHVGKLDPNRDGKQIFMVHETPSCYQGRGVEMHDAATGKILWSLDGDSHDVGRGTCMDIDPAYPGEECWAIVGGLMNASGRQISGTHPRSINFGLWWDGDLLREPLDGVHIDKWNPRSERLERLVDGADYGAASINGTKSTPVLSADLFGDWREEVVWRSRDNDALLVFSTTVPTPYRLTTLMHDPQYRSQVAGQNAGYNQPPHPSFYLGDGMKPPVQQPIYVP